MPEIIIHLHLNIFKNSWKINTFFKIIFENMLHLKVEACSITFIIEHIFSRTRYHREVFKRACNIYFIILNAFEKNI